MSALENIKTRTEGHTEGPWRTWQHGSGPRDSGVETTWTHDGDESKQITDWCFPADAELIAAAPKLLAALEAVEAHHQPLKTKAYGGAAIQICTTCSDDVGNWEPYPCPTLTTITEALQ